jgi:hypothetical protein
MRSLGDSYDPPQSKLGGRKADADDEAWFVPAFEAGNPSWTATNVTKSSYFSLASDYWPPQASRAGPPRQVRGTFFWAPLPDIIDKFRGCSFCGSLAMERAELWPSKSELTPQPRRRKLAGLFRGRRTSYRRPSHLGHGLLLFSSQYTSARNPPITSTTGIRIIVTSLISRRPSFVRLAACRSQTIGELRRPLGRSQ